MRSLVQISISFEVEDEDRPDVNSLLAAVETAVAECDGVDEVAADIVGLTRKYTLMAEIEGHDPDGEMATLEMAEVVKKHVKTLGEPHRYDPWTLEEMDD